MHIFIQREKNMKKILALAAVAVTAVALASADPLFVGHAYFGVGLGSQVTQSNGDPMGKGTLIDDSKSYSWNFGSNLDFGAGVAINIPFGDYFGFQPGVDFYVNNVGYHYENNVKNDTTFTYLSLDIPLLLTAKINKWNFSIGPYVSIPLGPVSATVSTSSDKFEGNHSWGSIGAVVGVGYEQRIGLGRLVIGGRYMHDFMPIDVKSRNTDTTVYKLYRGALAVDVAYKIPLSF